MRIFQNTSLLAFYKPFFAQMECEACLSVRTYARKGLCTQPLLPRLEDVVLLQNNKLIIKSIYKAEICNAISLVKVIGLGDFYTIQANFTKMKSC